MLCAVKLRVLGLMAYWYTGSAFHQIPQSYLEYFWLYRLVRGLVLLIYLRSIQTLIHKNFSKEAVSVFKQLYIDRVVQC